ALLRQNASAYLFRPGGAPSRHAAFKTRRARFRGTAPPTRRPATNALVPDPGAATTTTRVPFNLFPKDMLPPTAASRVTRPYAESLERPLALRLARMAPEIS